MKLYEELLVDQTSKGYIVRESLAKPSLFKSNSASEALQWAIDHIQTDNLAGAETGLKRGKIQIKVAYYEFSEK